MKKAKKSEKSKKMKKVKKILIEILLETIIALLAIVNITEENEKIQCLNHLDYQVSMKKNGDMNVVETWDINIIRTNTLLKNFILDKTKYGNITNVQVTDLQSGKKFKDIKEEMYHVTPDCFYGLATDPYTFEIAFGTGMEDKKGRRIFQISYTVEDVVKEYNDCQEIYWKFLGTGQNNIPAEKVTGKLILPEPVENIENLKVWGHGQVNGKIKKLNESEIAFNLKKLEAGSMLEIRVATSDKIFEVSKAQSKRNNMNLSNILEQEKVWADKTNEASKKRKNLLGIFVVIYAIWIIIKLIKIKNLNTAYKQKDNGIISSNIKYYRDIPREDTATPAEACYLYKFNKKKLDTANVQSKAVAATILDLCHKRKIQLRIGKKDKVYIKIISDDVEGLKDDELEIYELLKSVSKNKEFEVNKIKDYANKENVKYNETINKFVNSARNSLYELKLIDKKNEKKYVRYSETEFKICFLRYVCSLLIITFLLTNLPILKHKIIYEWGINYNINFLIFLVVLAPFAIVKTIQWKMQQKASNKIAVLTQAGSDEKAQWKGLAKYMQDYSLLKEKDILSLAVWEKYLIYATAFGIADKVIEQLKANYPKVFIKEKWNDEVMMQKYPVIYYSVNPFYSNIDDATYFSQSISNLENGIKKAYTSSVGQTVAHYSSSGDGRRRWILRTVAEAGGGRRPEWEADN